MNLKSFAGNDRGCKHQPSNIHPALFANLIVLFCSLNVFAGNPGDSETEKLLTVPFPVSHSSIQPSRMAEDQILNYEIQPERLLFSSGLQAEPNSTAAAAPPPLQHYKTESLFSIDYVKLAGQDIIHTFTAPARWDTTDWLIFAGVAGGIAGLTFADEDIQRAVQRNRNEMVNSVFDAIEPFGAEYSFGLIGAFYVGGELFHDERAKAVGLDGLTASIIASGIIATPTKYVVGRDRPPAGRGAGVYQPFSNNHSFPSGHATQAFAVASVIAEHYDSIWIKASSYTLATMVGFSRMNKNAHWASDVAAGAAIGTFVGRTVVHFNENHRHLALSPVIGPDIQAVQLTWSF
jgi:membrane-associated phospholipid phosphatase